MFTGYVRMEMGEEGYYIAILRFTEVHYEGLQLCISLMPEKKVRYYSNNKVINDIREHT